MKKISCMTKHFLPLILLFVLTFGCKSEKMATKHFDQSLTYLALGDSYTIGEAVPENERYPVQLQDSLKKEGVTIDKVQIIARTGWTTDELSAAIDSATLAVPYDLVTLLIGVNNQYRGRSPEDYRPEFVALLQRVIEFAGGDKEKVIVLSIPDWGVTPFAEGRDRDMIAQEIDAYNAVNREESEKAGVAWIDVTAISREAAHRTELLAADGLHPSGLMYHYWMADLFPVARKILTGQH